MPSFSVIRREYLIFWVISWHRWTSNYGHFQSLLSFKTKLFSFLLVLRPSSSVIRREYFIFWLILISGEHQTTNIFNTCFILRVSYLAQFLLVLRLSSSVIRRKSDFIFWVYSTSAWTSNYEHFQYLLYFKSILFSSVFACASSIVFSNTPWIFHFLSYFYIGEPQTTNISV